MPVPDQLNIIIVYLYLIFLHKLYLRGENSREKC
jgi:hypothetical protein